MNKHKEFIIKPIYSVLEEAIAASGSIGNGIETYPLCDYLMQSIFLKMTGFQEQKMKCICWQLATHDYDYRRILLANDDKLGECSAYKDKSNIYKRLIEQICYYEPSFKVNSIGRKNIRKNAKSRMNYIFFNTNLWHWGQRHFKEYEIIWTDIKNKNFATEHNALFPEMNEGISLKKIYEDHLYKQRNRIAHNTLSYQQNLPTLKTLVNEDYKYDNYFLWFAMLALIDAIFIELYKKYIYLLEDNYV